MNDDLLSRIDAEADAEDGSGSSGSAPADSSDGLAGLSLAVVFGELAASLDAHDDVGQTLDSVVQLAVETVPGCDFAGVSWSRTGEQIETPAATDDVVRRCDAVQYEFTEGPCVESATEGGPRVITDMAADNRWPAFARRCVELGMNSLMSCQLSSPRATMGALNLYSRSAHAFDDPDVQQIAMLYANHASVALAHRVLETDLKTAIETRGLIGQAIGILTERHRVTPQQGFDLLIRASQRVHIKVRDLAAQVVDTGLDPSLIVK